MAPAYSTAAAAAARSSARITPGRTGRTGASSARLYWESFRNTKLDPIATKTGCSIFPKEIFRASRRWAEKRFTNLVYWNELPKGGHFAAWEQPQIFSDEVRNGFRSLRR